MDLSLHEILFGYSPMSLLTPSCGLPELKNSVEYGDKLQGKILELIELVDANITKSAKQQQSSYHNEMDTATVLLEGRRCLLSTPLYTS